MKIAVATATSLRLRASVGHSFLRSRVVLLSELTSISLVGNPFGGAVNFAVALVSRVSV